MTSRTSTASVGALAALIGTVMVIAIPSALPLLPSWASDYGSALVGLAFLEYVTTAAGLVWWGVHELRS
ncbi:hypothetical protein VMT65_33025 [Nocardia sp. CDC153]|uniref:hypothetical protein n=1 Tax=Nocardia sp. CDC153 TaxID=3112167 RepID=UPI002DB880E4|nr:hypothetical protein [Nocardia sp. CDC153]MEC3957899.1 hypothetical protein [Nocardia sp. CDC153]